MKYSIVNSSGVVTGSGSTDGGGSSGKSYIGPFTFWSPQSDCPTSYTNMNLPVNGWNNSSVGVMNAGLKMPSAGYVSALTGLINGQTGSTSVTMQYYKNGTATGLTITGSQPTSLGPPVPLKQAGGAGFTFAVDDVISVYIVASASGLNQSFNAFLELVLT